MKNIACYYRLSKSLDNTKESQSITNQRKLIEEYIMKNDLLKEGCLVEYIDDGYSGKTMERPAINKLMKDVDNNLISIIVVKDFSRFCRDYLLMGQMLESFLYEKKVRFISINDYYDSIKLEESTTINEAFKNIIYDYYSVENSLKIKRGLDKCREKGMCIVAKAIYGYRKDNKNLVVNSYEKRIIQYIYKAYLEGISVREIVESLNKKDGSIKWTTAKVYRILKEEQYTGTMIYGRKQNNGIASKRRIYIEKNQWKRIRNHHEAIIDEKQFQLVREKMKKQ